MSSPRKYVLFTTFLLEKLSIKFSLVNLVELAKIKFILILCLFQLTATGQLIGNKIDSVYFANKFRIESKFNSNIIVPPSIKFQCFIALSFFPELQNIEIEFIEKKIRTTMAARPVIGTLLRRKKARKYRIFVNIDKSFDGLLLSQLPLDAQVGVIGHELSHLVDYSRKSFGSIVSLGVGYLFYSYRKSLEYKIDRIAVAYGLGWQLLHFAYLMTVSKTVSHKYATYKKRIYPLPIEIQSFIFTNNAK